MPLYILHDTFDLTINQTIKQSVNVQLTQNTITIKIEVYL